MFDLSGLGGIVLLVAVTIVVVCALGLWWFRSEAATKRRNEKILRGERVGVYFNPFIWNPLAPFFIAGIAWFSVYVAALLEATFGFGWLRDPFIFWLLVIAVIVLIMSSRGETVSVPPAHVAMLTILGMRFRFYLKEGTYYFGRIPGILDRTMDVKPMFTDEQGFINMGEIQATIWDTFMEDEKERNPVLNLISRETAAFYANLLIVIQLVDPYRTTTSEDPFLDVADRARSALRTAASFFTVRDNAAVRDVLGVLMSGYTIMTCFLRKQVGSYLEGSVVQDKGGVPMRRVVQPGEDLETVRREFREEVKIKAEPSMLEAVIDEATGKPWVEDRSVDDSLDEVVVAIGAKLLRATIAKISTSPDLREAADKAAQEGLERDSQLRSAATMAQARRTLLPSQEELDNPDHQLAMMIAAAKDVSNSDAIKVIYVPGAPDKISRGAAILGSQLGGKK